MTAGGDGGRVSGAYFDWGPPLPQEAWRRMRGWYISVVDHAPPPAQATLKRITAERVELYRDESPPGRTSPCP